MESILEIGTMPPYNKENVKDIIYDYYKRDFKYYGG